MRCNLKCLVCSAVALAAMILVGQVSVAADLVEQPDWAAIFGPDGHVIGLNGGVDAVFMEDKISDGIGLDMSALTQADSGVVYNRTVATRDDLGNGYVWATMDDEGHMQVYVGVEHLDTTDATWVEFEFNQKVVKVHGGTPWPISGARSVGDVLVHVELTAGTIASALFMRWDGTSYQLVSGTGLEGWNGLDYLACTGAPPIVPFEQDVWDAEGNPVAVARPRGFVEVGFNVAPLAGADVEFTSIQVRTPGDVILDGFRRIGFWAGAARTGGQR